MNDLLLLAGQHLLVLGGSGAMGMAIGRLARRHGAAVTLAGRDRQRLVQAAADIGTTLTPLQADLSSESGVLALIPESGPPYDHIVVATSASSRASSIPQTPLPNAQQAFARYWTSYLVLHHASRLLRPTGSITLLSGSSGRRPAIGYGVWSALHGGIEALAKAAALELAPLRVNVLSPGGIGLRPDRNLVHHLGQPDDVAMAALMVMANPAMTAAVIDVDGGERLGSWSGAEPGQ